MTPRAKRASAKKAKAPPRNKNGREKVAGEGRGKGGGRPLLEIDPKVVEGMAVTGAPNVEIADFLGIDVDTLTGRFSELLTKSRADINIRLRRAQITLAFGDRTRGIPPNPVMCIWLGKQRLKQSDAGRLEVTGADGAPLIPEASPEERTARAAVILARAQARLDEERKRA